MRKIIITESDMGLMIDYEGNFSNLELLGLFKYLSDEISYNTYNITAKKKKELEENQKD